MTSAKKTKSSVATVELVPNFAVKTILFFKSDSQFLKKISFWQQNDSDGDDEDDDGDGDDEGDVDVGVRAADKHHVCLPNHR